MLISPCCKAPVYVASSRKKYFTENDNPESATGTIMWYECSDCEKACDPVHE